jgi:alpha-L-fucosidase 2
MKIINYLIVSFLFPLSLVAAPKPSAPQSAAMVTPKKLKLWYNKPAKYFEEALVLGNGTQEATVFWGTDTDKIFLNDLTLWSGEPADPYMNKDAYKNLPGVRMNGEIN